MLRYKVLKKEMNINKVNWVPVEVSEQFLRKISKYTEY